VASSSSSSSSSSAAEVAGLRADLRRAREEAADRAEDFAVASHRASLLERELAAVRADRDALALEKERLKAECDAVAAAGSGNDSSAGAGNWDLAARQQEQVASLMRQLTAARSEAAQMGSLAEDRAQRLQSQSARMATLRAEAEAAEAEARRARATATALEQTTVRAKADAASARARLAALDDEHKAMRRRVAELEALQVAAAGAAVSTAAPPAPVEEQPVAPAAAAAAAAAPPAAPVPASSGADEAGRLRDLAAFLQREVAERTAQIHSVAAAARAAAAGYETEIASLRQALAAAELRERDASAECADLRDNNAALMATLQEADRHLARLAEAVRAAEEREAAANRLLNEVQTTRARAAAELTARAEAAEVIADELRRRLDSAAMRVGSVGSREEGYRAEAHAATVRSHALEQAVTQHRSHVTALSVELQALKQQMDAMARENGTLRGALGKAQNAFSSIAAAEEAAASGPLASPVRMGSGAYSPRAGSGSYSPRAGSNSAVCVPEPQPHSPAPSPPRRRPQQLPEDVEEAPAAAQPDVEASRGEQGRAMALAGSLLASGTAANRASSPRRDLTATTRSPSPPAQARNPLPRPPIDSVMNPVDTRRVTMRDAVGDGLWGGGPLDFAGAVRATSRTITRSGSGGTSLSPVRHSASRGTTPDRRADETRSLDASPARTAATRPGAGGPGEPNPSSLLIASRRLGANRGGLGSAGSVAPSGGSVILSGGPPTAASALLSPSRARTTLSIRTANHRRVYAALATMLFLGSQHADKLAKLRRVMDSHTDRQLVIVLMSSGNKSAGTFGGLYVVCEDNVEAEEAAKRLGVTLAQAPNPSAPAALTSSSILAYKAYGGPGPLLLTPAMVHTHFKYDTTARQFKDLATPPGGLSVMVDAVGVESMAVPAGSQLSANAGRIVEHLGSGGNGASLRGLSPSRRLNVLSSGSPLR
jgi:hypothetical protein